MDQVARKLEERPTEQDLENVGIQRTNRSSMSDLLAGTAVELEKQMTADKVAHALETRPTEEQLEQIGIQKTKRGNLSDALASTAVDLERNMTADKVSQTLETRPSESWLEETGVIRGRRNSNLSNILVPAVVELEVSILARASMLNVFRLTLPFGSRKTSPATKLLTLWSIDLPKMSWKQEASKGLTVEV